jgi:hypothetical protein
VTPSGMTFILHVILIIILVYRYVMRSSIICSLHQILVEWSNQGGWGGQGNTRGRREMHTHF